MDIVLPLADVTVWAPWLVLLGFVIGCLSGLFGVGGAFLLTPALYILFKIKYQIAVGSGLVQVFCTALFASSKRWRKGYIDFRLGLMVAPAAIAGTWLGKAIMKWLGAGDEVILNGRAFPLLDLVMSALFFVLLTAVGLFIFRETAGSSDADAEQSMRLANRVSQFQLWPMWSFPRSEIKQLSIWVPLVFAFTVGIMTGLLGVGGGFINFPLLVYVLGVPTLIAVGTSAFQILFAAGYGSIIHYLDNHVEFKLVGLLLLGSFAGAQLGVALAGKLGGRKLRRYFSLVLALGALMVIVDMTRQIFF